MTTTQTLPATAQGTTQQDREAVIAWLVDHPGLILAEPDPGADMPFIALMSRRQPRRSHPVAEMPAVDREVRGGWDIIRTAEGVTVAPAQGDSPLGIFRTLAEGLAALGAAQAA